MLLGTSKMKLSQATVRQALQEYFDRTFAEGKAPLVKQVTAPGLGYTPDEFDIDCEQAKPEPAGPPVLHELTDVKVVRA